MTPEEKELMFAQREIDYQKKQIEKLKSELETAKTDKSKAIDYYHQFVAGHHALPIEQSQEIKKFKIGFNGEKREISNLEIIFHRPDDRARTSPENGVLGGRPRTDDPSPNALYKREYYARRKLETSQTQT